MSAMRGSACITAKFDSGALRGDLVAPARSALARPSPSSTRYCDRPIAAAFLGVVDAAGQHHVGHARDADQARDARRAAAADEEAALAFGQAVEGAAPRRRGCAPRSRARGRRRPPRRAAPRPPARGRTGSASNAACHERECTTPSATLRSDSSDRSRPAQKCSPSPLSTTARVVSGRLMKAVCSCATSASLSALRLAGRFSRTWQTGAALLDAQQVERQEAWRRGASCGNRRNWLMIVNKSVQALLGFTPHRRA